MASWNKLRLICCSLIFLAHHAIAFVPSQHRVNRDSIAFRSTVTSAAAAVGYFEDGNERIPEGRVANITQWLTWSDRSLKDSCDDGRGSLFDRINAMSGEGTISTPQQIHESERFAVLSHGNQSDPIYNYVNAAGFRVFRWPEDVYYQLPSRKSAPEGAARNERARVIDNTVAGDITYIGEAVRVRYPNATVTLRDAILWNVYDDDGCRAGQTVLFDAERCSFSDESEDR